MREIALHILDIAENGVAAGADIILIQINENIVENWLDITISDNGKGMDNDTVASIVDPFITSRTTRKVGLGIPLFKAAAEACKGTFKITSQLGKGTKVDVRFQYDHIDRMPLGNIQNTILTLLIGYQHIHWIFHYQVNDEVFEFDDEPIKKELEGISLTDPSVLKFIREYLEEGIQEIMPE
ncbi:MAG: ATP-binding protein [Anaerolineaceae bacterium]|nr:ATP-binding protein [Anaerolineaceae bacterium]